MKNKIIDNCLKVKVYEFHVLNTIFADFFTKKKESKKQKIDKIFNLLLKTIQNNLDLDIKLNDIFNNEGIKQFRIICQKFGLIKSSFPIKSKKPK